MFKKPDPLSENLAAAASKLAHVCTLNQEAMVENIATRVLERLTPILMELLHGFIRTTHPAGPNPSRYASPDATAHFTTLQKGKEKMVVPDSSADMEEEDQEEDIQAAIMLYMHTAGKLPCWPPWTFLYAITFSQLKQTGQPCTRMSQPAPD